VERRASLDDMEKLKLLTLMGRELPPFGRPARSQSLYRLRYRDSKTKIYLHFTAKGQRAAVIMEI
jgi:hypothetical protein